MSVSRRSFLKSSAATAAISLVGGAVSPVAGKASGTAMQVGPGNKWPGRVVVNFNRSVVTLPSTVDTVMVKKMIDDSVLLLTGKDLIGEAWKAVFPSSLSAASTIAVKVPLGCANSTMAPHWSSVKAIVDGLTQMDFSGTKFPAGNITIYEMQCSDNFSRYGYTATNIPGVKILRDDFTENATDGANNLQYAKTLTSNFLINVFRAGGHWTEFGGFTLGFKNHYGTYTPVHGTDGTGYVRDINCKGVVFNKSVLSVCVGLFGAKEMGDPGDPSISYLKYAKTMDSSITDAVPPTTIIMSTDPVAAEMQTIKMMRVNNGKSYAPTDLPAYLKASGGVSGGLTDATYNIGVIDEAAMDLRRIINGQIITTAARPQQMAATFQQEKIRTAHIAATKTAFIEYCLPILCVGTVATVDIFDMKGALVHTATIAVAGVVGHYSWNEKNGSGKSIAKGVFMVRINAGNSSLTGKLTITT